MKSGSNTSSLDYDRLAGSYHRRYEISPMTGTEAALKKLVANEQAKRILEAGCGTGYWLEALQGHEVRLFGLDRSQGMLREARRRGVSTALVHGDACALPFAENNFDLILVVNALHHFASPLDFLHGVHRSLRPMGCLVLVGMEVTQRLKHWYVYDYFPNAREIDIARYPGWEQIAGWLAAAGFGPASRQVVETIEENWYGRSVFDDPFLQKESNSTLALLDDVAYAAGLARLEAAIEMAASDHQPLVFHSRLELEVQIARKAQGV